MAELGTCSALRKSLSAKCRRRAARPGSSSIAATTNARIRSSTVLSVGPTTSGFPRLIERLRLFQTKSHGRVRATLGPMSSAAARAKHRHQRLIGFAAYRAVSLNCANVDRGWVPLITLRSRGALRSLCSSLALRSRHALDALCALRARRSLRSRIPFWARVSAAPGKRQRHADRKYRKSPHAKPPVFVSDRCWLRLFATMPSTA